MNKLEELKDYGFSPKTGEDWVKYMGRARKHREEILSLANELQSRLDDAVKVIEFYAKLPYKGDKAKQFLKQQESK